MGAGWAGTSICVLTGSRTEDLFIFEQDQGKAGTLNHYRACFVAHTITKDAPALPPSPWRARPGPPATTEPLSACLGDLRLRKKEQSQIFGFKHGFRSFQQPVCGLNAGPVHWGRRDGVPRSSDVLRDIVMWLPPNTSPSLPLTASKASEDPSPLALHNEHFGAQPQLLNNNNNLETFSCNICSRGLFLGGNVRD